MRYGFRNKREEQFPLMLVLEITNICNYSCLHCPYSEISKRPDYKPKFMGWEIYRKIADEASLFKDTVFRFVCDGEPMMHPDFLRMLEYVKKKGVAPVCITTNGYFLTEEAARRIIEYGCDIVEVSLDALHERSYQKIRVGGDFKRVMLNTHRLIELRNSLNKDVKIMVSVVDQPQVKNELEAFKQYWGRKVDRVIIRKLTSIGGLVKKGEIKFQAVQRWPCPLLWRRLFINVEGYAEFCVDDWLDESIVGDVKKEGISEIWTSKVYQTLREFHGNKQFNNIEKCVDCLDWPARTWEYDYFHALDRVLGCCK